MNVNIFWIKFLILIVQLVQRCRGDTGLLEKLSYVHISARLEAIKELNALREQSNATLNSAFPKNQIYLDMMFNKFYKTLSTTLKINSEIQSCITDINSIHKSDPFVYDVPKIVSQHDFEKNHIYGKIFQDLYHEALQSVATIASGTENFGIENDCEEKPECATRIENEIGEVQNKYENVVKTTQMLFIEQENNYKDRISDYYSFLEKALKPYYLLADQCLQKHLRKGIDMYNQNILVN